MRWITILFLCIASLGYAQELFIFSEPASTMPKNAVMFRMNSRHYADRSGYYYKLNPELGYGIAKNLMAHIDGYYSNWALSAGGLDALGMSGKYRVFSQDELHRHKRLALTGKLIYSFQPLPMQWMIEDGNTSLASVGIIYTQLIYKLALSGKVSYLKPLQDWNTSNGEVLQWQVSSGLLTFPLQYKNYKQVNINIYAEYLGQQNLGLTYDRDAQVLHTINHDLGLGIQFILASRFTTEMAYRMNVGGNMDRMTNNMYYFNLEYLLFR